MIVYGEMDDSPGGQFLGLLAVIAGIVGIIKSRKKTGVGTRANGSDPV